MNYRGTIKCIEENYRQKTMQDNSQNKPLMAGVQGANWQIGKTGHTHRELAPQVTRRKSSTLQEHRGKGEWTSPENVGSSDVPLNSSVRQFQTVVRIERLKGVGGFKISDLAAPQGSQKLALDVNMSFQLPLFFAPPWFRLWTYLPFLHTPSLHSLLVGLGSGTSFSLYLGLTGS